MLSIVAAGGTIDGPIHPKVAKMMPALAREQRSNTSTMLSPKVRKRARVPFGDKPWAQGRAPRPLHPRPQRWVIE